MDSLPDLEKAIDKSRAESIRQLKSLYRDELAAVETYDAALHHTTLLAFGDPLRRERAAHAERVIAIGERLRALDAPVPPSSGAWGTWVRLATEAAASLAPEIAFSVILEEEESLAKDYRGAIPILDGISGRLVATRLLPAQIATYEVIYVLHAEVGR